ncbi:MAG: preprotein translocase subunit SecG [Halocynthiibacter sp.]
MENVVLIIHLILALCLIGIVLLQRSEGGGLGMGGGGGGGGVMSSRAAGSALAKLTWILAIAFITTSMTLTVFAARNSAGTSVIDQLGINTNATETVPEDPQANDLLIPTTPETSGADTPLAPARADE